MYITRMTEKSILPTPHEIAFRLRQVPALREFLKDHPDIVKDFARGQIERRTLKLLLDFTDDGPRHHYYLYIASLALCPENSPVYKLGWNSLRVYLNDLRLDGKQDHAKVLMKFALLIAGHKSAVRLALSEDNVMDSIHGLTSIRGIPEPMIN